VQESRRSYTDTQTIVFTVILSFICAFILSALASALSVPKEEAKELDRSRQMLQSAQIYNSLGYFQIEKNDTYIPAKLVPDGQLVEGTKDDHPSSQDILTVYRNRIVPILVDDAGNVTSFEKAKINYIDYLRNNKKQGYANLPLKLAYKILPNVPEKEINEDLLPIGYIIPVSGFGLWDAIYGYLAIAPDGDTVIGVAWYDQKETPGLGANIAEQDWQSQFPGKKILQADSSGITDFLKSSIGLTVVRGKVADVVGREPKALSSLDGMAGATLTGNGVTKAYKDSLTPYRNFFKKLHDQNKK